MRFDNILKTEQNKKLVRLLDPKVSSYFVSAFDEQWISKQTNDRTKNRTNEQTNKIKCLSKCRISYISKCRYDSHIKSKVFQDPGERVHKSITSR